MFAESDPSPPPTSYGALYVASLVHVYGGPLGLWVKVIQFTGENKHGVKIKHLPYFLLEPALFKDHEDEKKGVTVSHVAIKERSWRWQNEGVIGFPNTWPSWQVRRGCCCLIKRKGVRVTSVVTRCQTWKQRWWGWWWKRRDSHQPSFTIGRYWLSGFNASHLTSRGWGCCHTIQCIQCKHCIHTWAKI